MRVALIENHGLVPKITEKIISPPGEAELQLKVEIAGLNFYEYLIWKGEYAYASNPPYVLGGECVGTVVKVGKNLKSFNVGDRVLTLAQSAQNTTGAFAEYMNVPANFAYKVPSALDSKLLLAGAMTYFTSLFLIRNFETRPNAKVLIHSAAGGVGSALTEVLQSLNPSLEIFGTCSPFKKSFLKERGIQWFDMESMEEDFFDFIFDSVGKEALEKNLTLLKSGVGVLHSYGYASGPIDDPSLATKLRQKNLGFQGHLIWPYLQSKKVVEVILSQYFSGLESGRYHPVIDQIYPLEDLGFAFERIGARKNIGKILIQIS